MPSTRTRLVVSAVLLAAVAAAAHAQGQPSKAEQALKYRKAVYQAIAWNFGPMSAMAQGKVPYDAKIVGDYTGLTPPFGVPEAD